MENNLNLHLRTRLWGQLTETRFKFIYVDYYLTSINILKGFLVIVSLCLSSTGFFQEGFDFVVPKVALKIIAIVGIVQQLQERFFLSFERINELKQYQHECEALFVELEDLWSRNESYLVNEEDLLNRISDFKRHELSIRVSRNESSLHNLMFWIKPLAKSNNNNYFRAHYY